MNKEEFAEKAKERYRNGRDFLQNWKAQARDDYAFISGNQWLPEDEAILMEQKRPPITFNYSEKMIDAVAGAEVGNRQEVSYIPRGIEDVGLTELWNAAAKWVRDECNAEDEESDAFRDSLICGMGWTWTHMSYEEDLDGKIIVERIDPLEMTYDPAASKAGLVDRKWHRRTYWVDNEEIKRQWPDASMVIEDANTSIGIIRPGQRYEDGENDERDRHKNQSQIGIYECYELETIYRVASGEEIIEVSNSDFAKIRKDVEDNKIPFLKQSKRVYYIAYFAGDTLLEVKKSPCQDGFCFQAITAKRDRNRNTFYGLVRVMKDPQRWANKWLSQILHIINSNAKGGLIAEIGAFVDPVKAREEWASPDSIIELNEGGINKVTQKQPPPYPAGLDKLMEFALSSLPMVTGINLEALGLANREQAGVLEAQRKQAAYGLLAPMFDALRRYRKNQGRILLSYINNFISDGRLIRIGGPESQQYLPLTKVPGAPRYDVVVDQSPNAPDVKQRTWETLNTILPAMMKAGIPVPPKVLEYTPLPSSLVTEWQSFIGEQQQMNEEMQNQLAEMEKENEALKQDQQIKAQELMQKQQQAEAEMVMKQRAQEAEIELETAKAQAEFEMEQLKMDREFELEQRRLRHENHLKQQQMDNDFKMKAFTAGVSPDDAGKFTIDVSTGDLPELINQFAKASAMMAEQAKTNGNLTMQAIERLTGALSKPRQLVFDRAGKPVGSQLNWDE